MLRMNLFNASVFKQNQMNHPRQLHLKLNKNKREPSANLVKETTTRLPILKS